MTEPTRESRLDLLSLFQRGRWGYDLFWLFLVAVMLASPFPFLKTKKEHALDQIRAWQQSFLQHVPAEVSFYGVSQGPSGPWFFAGLVRFEPGQRPNIQVITRWPTVIPGYFMRSTLDQAQETLQRFLAIYPFIGEEVFEINEVWLVHRVANRILLYFPAMSRNDLRIRHVYLWGKRQNWVPLSLSLQTEKGELYTFYFSDITLPES